MEIDKNTVVKNTTEEKYRIFLSYGHDIYAETAEKIKADLENSGIEVWFDLERIREGRDWEQYIEDGLTWCNKVVLLMTPHSVRRKNKFDPKSDDGFCLNELAYAILKRKDIIPVLLVELHQAPPLSIIRVQYLDLRDSIPIWEKKDRYENKFHRLVDAIRLNNLDFEGNQSQLLDLLQPLDFQNDVRAHLTKFSGRVWLLQIIQDWVYSKKNENIKSYGKIFWIRGKPGVGKTALSAYIGDRCGEVIAYHLCSYDREYKSDPNRLILSLAYQLSQEFPEYQNRLLNIDLKGIVIIKDTPTLFEELIIKPFSPDFPQPDKPVFILIDAIDEVTRDGRNLIAEFIRNYWDRTPIWMKLLITSRPEPFFDNIFSSIEPFDIIADSESNLEDIKNYLRTEFSNQKIAVSEEIIRVLAYKSEGLFLYVDWIIKEIDSGRLSLSNIDDFPLGLRGIYEQFFIRQFPDISKYETELKSILEIICAQREPLPLNLLEAAFHNSLDDTRRDMFRRSNHVRRMLFELGSLFPIERDSSKNPPRETIKPFHKSIIDWLTEINKKTGYMSAGRYSIDLEEGVNNLVNACWAEYEVGIEPMSDYSLKYLHSYLIHLEKNQTSRADARKKLEILTSDRAFHRKRMTKGLKSIYIAHDKDIGFDLSKKIKSALTERNHFVNTVDDISQKKPDSSDSGFDEAIEKAIENCDVFLLLMTNKSVRRRHLKSPQEEGECLNEIAYAVGKGKLIIPLLLENLSDGIPLSICRIQYLDITDIVKSKIDFVTNPRFKDLVDVIENGYESKEQKIYTLMGFLKPFSFSTTVAHAAKNFSGRSLLLDNIDRWLSNPLNPQKFLLIGSPGSGKTVIAGYLCYKNSAVIAMHFCSNMAPATLDVKKVITSISCQIALRLPEYRELIEAMDIAKFIDATGDATHLFISLIVEPLQKIVNKEQYLVVIDGIDEAFIDDKNEIFNVIIRSWERMPPSMKLFATSRPIPEIHMVQDTVIINLDGIDATEDIKNVIQKRVKKNSTTIPEDKIEEILKQCDGNFLYAQTVLDALDKGQISINQISQINNLSGLYERFFKENFPDLEEFNKDYRTVIGIICAQKEPLPITLLSSATGLELGNLRMRLKKLSVIFCLKMGQNTVQTLQPFHTSIIQWLTEFHDMTGYPNAGPYMVNLEEGQRLLANACWAEYNKGVETMSDYSIKYLPLHLRDLINNNEIEEEICKKIDILNQDILFNQIRNLRGNIR